MITWYDNVYITETHDFISLKLTLNNTSLHLSQINSRFAPVSGGYSMLIGILCRSLRFIPLGL